MSDNSNIKMNVNEKTPTPSLSPSPSASVSQSASTSAGSSDESKSIDPNLKAEIPLVFLQNVKNIISVAGDRGAFKTEEMYVVGSIYNSLTKLLETKSSESSKE